MNIEIVEFYPVDIYPESQGLTGSLRVRLPDLGVELLGCFVSKRGDTWFISLPSKKGVHHVTGALVSYPVLVFTDKEKTRELVNAIRSEGRKFVEKMIEDKGLLSLAPQKPRNEVADVATPHKPKMKVFVDPPKRIIRRPK